MIDDTENELKRLAISDELEDTKNELKRLAISQDSKVSDILFYWVIGGIVTFISIGIVVVSGILNYAVNRIDQIDNKHQIDHDKITKLETQLDIS